MIGLDTNVIVRFLVQDEPVQSALASSLITSRTAKDPGYISTVVLVEVFWVLKRAYKLPNQDVPAALLALVSSDEIVVEGRDAVRAALREGANGYDFADALVALEGTRHGCDYTATFDRKASSLAGMRLLAEN